MPVIHRPSPDDGVEFRDEGRLGDRPLAPHPAADGLLVPLLRPAAGGDEGLEAEWPAEPVFPGVGASDAVLADLEPEEVEPHVPLEGGERVGQAGLGRLQLQAHPREPGADQAVGLPGDAFLFVQDD